MKFTSFSTFKIVGSHTFWRKAKQWERREAALKGSSYLRLPRPIDWLIGHICIHHIHHLNSRIPNYKLREVHDSNPEFNVVAQFGFPHALRSLNLALWDEENQKIIRFKDLKSKQQP